jgi:hypothetical protein
MLGSLSLHLFYRNFMRERFAREKQVYRSQKVGEVVVACVILIYIRCRHEWTPHRNHYQIHPSERPHQNRPPSSPSTQTVTPLQPLPRSRCKTCCSPGF